MYGRIDIPSSYKGWPQATMMALKEMVERANAAHLAAKGNAAAHLAANRTLQQEMTKIEACICGNDYESHAEMRAALTSIRDKLRTLLVTAGQSPQAEDEPQTSFKLDIMGGVDLAERVVRIDKVSAKLANTRDILHSPTVELVLKSIADLKALREPQAIAEAHKLQSVAAAVPLAMRVDLVANANVPEVQALRKELAVAKLLLTPIYTKIQAKVKELEALTEQKHSSCLEASIMAECSAVGYDQTVALAHLNDVVDRALASARDIAKTHKSIVSSTTCMLEKRPILSEKLLLSDRTACIGASTNLTQLSEGLATHAKRLKDAEAALPNLKELGGLVNVCRSQRFGGELDYIMSKYLREIIRGVANCENLPAAINHANQAHAELIAITKGLRNPGINEIHLIIQDLRTMSNGSYGAKAKATALEDAAKEIPINQRANLKAHLNEPKVRALFDVLARSYSTYGLGSIATDPMSVSEYQKVMNAIKPEKPGAPEPAPQVRLQP